MSTLDYPPDVSVVVVETHHLDVLHTPSDTFVDLPVVAVRAEMFGPAVHVGPYSLSPADARLLAASLVILADLADGVTW